MNRTTFLKMLERESIARESMIDLIKKDSLPLVMWGMGDVATAVADYLGENGIPIEAIWVDYDSADNNDLILGLKPESLENICQKYTEFSVVLGHSHYEYGRELCNKCSAIKKVYYPFSIHYGQYELVKYSDIEQEADRFVCLCEALEDKKSVNNLVAYLNTKMTGNVQYIFDVYESEMSFFDNDVFRASDNEVLLDVGAYTGDTIREFLRKTNGNYEKIIAFEPDTDSFLKLSEYVAQERMKNVVISKLGLWNSRQDLTFSTGNEQLSSVEINDHAKNRENEITIYADRADSILNEEITLIKINYYKGVLEAIEGCEKLLTHYHPRLAIDVGFDIYNVLLLFEYLNSLKLNYKFYLRFNRAMSSTLTLYVV